MAIIKCKMCGGDVELAGDKTFGTCEYCGSSMTFPKVDDEQRAAAFNRGNHFRRIGEFDKALAVYERIVREDDTDAEAHWCCALCRFGIEYVEDPATYEYLPTCHRASFDNFLEDVDYLAAVEHSEGVTKRQYQKDAAKIAEVQRGILATSQNEEPFDVFICYKESDENGERTKDSLMAQDVYYQLTDQGYRVFFARITLEDMVGKQYEPYIFAALNSAKVMIVIGTKAEYMNAVWVKNEWSRFLAMMKKDRHKLLLPCYRDMDPYDMPEQLSVLQSYDMSKIGFIQDLIRGIKKVLDAEKKPEIVQETVMVQQANANTAALLKRGNFSLEDGDWKKADQLFEEVLNLDPECAEAYLGKYFAEKRCKDIAEIVKKEMDAMAAGVQKEMKTLPEEQTRIDEWFESINDRYVKTSIISKQSLVGVIPTYTQYASETSYWMAQSEITSTYLQSDKHLQRAYLFAQSAAKEMLETNIALWHDMIVEQIRAAQIRDEECAQKIMEQCEERIRNADNIIMAKCQQQAAYIDQQYLKMCAEADTTNDIWRLRNLCNEFTRMSGYKDSKEKAAWCQEKARKIEVENAARRDTVARWIREGRCTHCGGEFVGLFGKKCAKCGKEKSY